MLQHSFLLKIKAFFQVFFLFERLSNQASLQTNKKPRLCRRPQLLLNPLWASNFLTISFILKMKEKIRSNRKADFIVPFFSFRLFWEIVYVNTMAAAQIPAAEPQDAFGNILILIFIFSVGSFLTALVAEIDLLSLVLFVVGLVDLYLDMCSFWCCLSGLFCICVCGGGVVSPLACSRSEFDFDREFLAEFRCRWWQCASRQCVDVRNIPKV